MSFFSRRQFALSSRFDPERAQARLRGAIGPAAPSSARTDSRPFTGSMSGASFSVTRVSRGRNSFRPLILGSIDSAPGGGSLVTGTMRLHGAVLGFMGLLIAMPAWLFVNMLWRSVTTDRWDVTLLIIPGGILFLVAMVGFGFAVERRRALGDLAAIVDGDNN